MHIVRSYGSSAWAIELKRNSVKTAVVRRIRNFFPESSSTSYTVEGENRISLIDKYKSSRQHFKSVRSEVGTI
jgi:hypothetical protein